MIKYLQTSLLLFSFICLVACDSGSIDPVQQPRPTNPSKPIDAGNGNGTENENAATLADVVDDESLVDYLSGEWGFYNRGEGYKFSTHNFRFDKTKAKFNYDWSYNKYQTLFDIQIVKNTYFLKIKDAILFKSDNGTSFEKYGRIERVSEDQMNIYPITETGTTYKEFLPYKLTKINFVEKPAADVVFDKNIASTLTGKWSAGSATVFDFSAGKNYFQLTTTFQGAKTIQKTEFKISEAGVLKYRKWGDDFDPSWKSYNFKIEGEKLIISNSNGYALYTLTK